MCNPVLVEAEQSADNRNVGSEVPHTDAAVVAFFLHVDKHADALRRDYEGINWMPLTHELSLSLRR